jgi:PEP-CTERM motif
MRHRLLAGISFAALLACGPSASAATTTFLFTGAVQTFTAPTTGTYQILAFGAQGGSGGATGAAGGGGAEIGGDFSLTAGETLGIFVGGAGGSAIKGGGGGGGSFVIQPVSAKLVIAGGGGGYNGSGGGGGGSFDAGVDQVLKAGVQAGDGEVMITELASGPPLPVPEPSSLAMIATGLAGLAGLGAMRRRSKT